MGSVQAAVQLETKHRKEGQVSNQKEQGNESASTTAQKQGQETVEIPQDGQQIGARQEIETHNPNRFIPVGVQPLSPDFFDDLPTTYKDNNHRRRHLGYGVTLQPPLRDPFKESLQRPRRRLNPRPEIPPGLLDSPSKLPRPYPPSLVENTSEKRYCCVRRIGVYQICRHHSTQKKHMTVKSINSMGSLRGAQVRTDAPSQTHLTGLSITCSQKRCKSYKLEYALIEGTCSECNETYMTSLKSPKWSVGRAKEK